MALEIKIVNPEDGDILTNVADHVFDNEVNEAWYTEFLHDPRHHLAVAIADGQVVAFASAVHYIHPDKAPELWINEIGVAPTHRKRGVGQKLMRALFSVGKQLGCGEAWVLTEQSNTAARGLYESVQGKKAAETPILYSFKL